MTTPIGAPDLNSEYIAWFKGTGMNDVASIGGKGASLGEMYSSLTEKGIPIPNGFTVTVDAYAEFVDSEIDSMRWSGVSEAEGLPGLRDLVMKASTLSANTMVNPSFLRIGMTNERKSILYTKGQKPVE